MTEQEWDEYHADIARVAAIADAVIYWVPGRWGWQLLLMPTQRVDITRIAWPRRALSH